MICKYIYITTYEKSAGYRSLFSSVFSVFVLKSCEIKDPKQAEHIVANAKRSFPPRSTWKTVPLLLSIHFLTHWFELNICMKWNIQ